MSKKKILAGFIIGLALLMSGCGKDNNVSGPKFKESRFELVERIDSIGDIKFYIVRDSETGVEYILANGHGRFGLSPLYDKEGNISMEE